jgi:hypothetical protein
MLEQGLRWLVRDVWNSVMGPFAPPRRAAGARRMAAGAFGSFMGKVLYDRGNVLWLFTLYTYPVIINL